MQGSLNYSTVPHTRIKRKKAGHGRSNMRKDSAHYDSKVQDDNTGNTDSESTSDKSKDESRKWDNDNDEPDNNKRKKISNSNDDKKQSRWSRAIMRNTATSIGGAIATLSILKGYPAIQEWFDRNKEEVGYSVIVLLVLSSLMLTMNVCYLCLKICNKRRREPSISESNPNSHQDTRL